MHSQKRLHHGHSNLGGLKGNYRAIAANDLVMGQQGGAIGTDAVLGGSGEWCWVNFRSGFNKLHVVFLPVIQVRVVGRLAT
jgi:hypothetical protein